MLKKKNLAWQNCSEGELAVHLSEWLKAHDLKNSIVFLEGEMGAGKSTFARQLLSEIAPSQRSMGSPTFPLVQEYRGLDQSPVYHIDLYRLKSEQELQDSGIESQIEENGSTALVEWASMFAESFMHWFDPKRNQRKKVYLIQISATEDDSRRNYELEDVN